MSYDYSVREPIETILRDRYIALLEGYIEDFQVILEDFDDSAIGDFDAVTGLVREKLENAFSNPNLLLSDDVTAFTFSWFGLVVNEKVELEPTDYDTEYATDLIKAQFGDDNEFYTNINLKLISYNFKPHQGSDELVVEHIIDGVKFYTRCFVYYEKTQKYREMAVRAGTCSSIKNAMVRLIDEMEDELMIIRILQEPIYLTAERKTLIKNCKRLTERFDKFNEEL